MQTFMMMMSYSAHALPNTALPKCDVCNWETYDCAYGHQKSVFNPIGEAAGPKCGKCDKDNTLLSSIVGDADCFCDCGALPICDVCDWETYDCSLGDQSSGFNPIGEGAGPMCGSCDSSAAPCFCKCADPEPAPKRQLLFNFAARGLSASPAASPDAIDAVAAAGAAAAADPCFPSSAKVTKADGTKVPISSLKEGDVIVAATADGMMTTDTVSLLSVAKPQESAASYVKLNHGYASLTLTEGHHVPVGAACCSELKLAKDIAVGEKVWSVKDGKAVATTVTAKSTTTASGLHSPVLTNGGFPVVDGFVTSFDAIEKVTLAKHGLASLVAACKASGTCGTFMSLFSDA